MSCPSYASDGAGTTHAVNPADVETLAPALRLRLRSALSMVAGRDGSLTLRLAEGAELSVQRRDMYESGQTFGHGSLADATMLCSPHEGPPWASKRASSPSNKARHRTRYA